MPKKENERWCPLTFSGNGLSGKCEEKECAWWYQDQCAISSLAKSLYVLTHSRKLI